MVSIPGRLKGEMDGEFGGEEEEGEGEYILRISLLHTRPQQQCGRAYVVIAVKKEERCKNGGRERRTDGRSERGRDQHMTYHSRFLDYYIDTCIHVCVQMREGRL